jgi:CRP-like cAMP-binding protein
VNDPGGRETWPQASPVVNPSRIAAFDLFDDLPPAELDELATVMTEVDAEAGTTIVTCGDFGYVLYAIESGEADVVVDGEVTGRTLGPGDTFGEIALLVTGRRTATIVARTDMRLLSLFDRDFRRLQGRVPELDGALRKLSGERLAQ